jgi:hypothetical protein
MYAAVAALAAVTGQFFALSHEISVRHVRCAEHGELTHVATAAGSPAAAPAEDIARTEEAASATAHDHCTLAVTLQASVGPLSRQSAGSSLPPPVPFLPPGEAPSRDRAFLLASAPKTSPPSA